MASFISTPLIEAENALAMDANFLTWTGATDAADAKANYIFSDDSRVEADLPAKYAAITEIEDWSLVRNAEGAGRGSFNFTGGLFAIVFVEEVGTTESSYTSTNRIAFKDQVAGFINDFLSNFEGQGQRVRSISKVPFTDTFPFRGSATDDGLTGGGKYYYQYGITVNTGVF